MNFEKDLRALKPKMLSMEYAQKVYAALCNMVWIHSSRPDNYKQVQEDTWIMGGWIEEGWEYSCSWRSAGAIIASIRDEGEDYLNFYCSGNEGQVDEEVAEDLKILGWEPDLDNQERWEKVHQNQYGVNELEY